MTGAVFKAAPAALLLSAAASSLSGRAASREAAAGLLWLRDPGGFRLRAHLEAGVDLSISAVRRTAEML